MMPVTRIRFLSSMLACLMAMGCSNISHNKAEQEGLIARDTFMHVLTEVHLIEGVKKQRLLRNDEEGLVILQHYAELFERFNVDEQRFKTTYEWWYKHPKEMDGLLEEVADRLARMERETNQQN
jgi:hypothetical protein